MAFSDKCLELIELKKSDGSNSTNDTQNSEQIFQKELNLEEALSLTPHSQGEFQDINIYGLTVGKRVMLWYKLWEIMMLNENLLIVADSPSVCSEMVYGLLSIVKPFESCCEFFPYMTVFDKDVDKVSFRINESQTGIVIGVTNPLFLKVCFELTF
jgi:hypothetical protein